MRFLINNNNYYFYSLFSSVIIQRTTVFRLFFWEISSNFGNSRQWKSRSVNDSKTITITLNNLNRKEFTRWAMTVQLMKNRWWTKYQPCQIISNKKDLQLSTFCPKIEHFDMENVVGFRLQMKSHQFFEWHLSFNAFCANAVWKLICDCVVIRIKHTWLTDILASIWWMNGIPIIS